MDSREKAYALLKEWKKDGYVFGIDVLDQVGGLVKLYGDTTLLVSNTTYLKPVADRVVASLESAGVSLAGGLVAPDAKPNAPREDVYRLTTYILSHTPDSIVVIGGGSSIDAVKAANALAALGRDHSCEIDSYFGTNEVSKAIAKTGRKLIPVIAVETSASSGAHLTKYSNITDPVVGQKKLIVDEAVVPPVAIFDYATTTSMPLSVTIDGALDAIAHTFEVFCGAKDEHFDKVEEITATAIDLVVSSAAKLIEDPRDIAAREAIGLATDLGGYAIMVGGTSGAHLTSFSLVDIVSHGTACGIMNPYYAVFYSKAIQRQLKVLARIFKEHGYIAKDIDALEGRELAVTVAQGMIDFAKSIKAPTTLAELPGFTDAHIERALKAAQDPQLEMKLKNMPVPMTASDVMLYMQPILQAAKTGDMGLIKEK